MKKTTCLVILLAIILLNAMQSCEPPIPAAGEPDERVDIYLKSIMVDGQYHLEMRDSKGNKVRDSLTTKFIKVKGEPGMIKWKKDNDSGIKKITSIESSEDPTVIFEDGAHSTVFNGWKLQLLEKLYAEPKDSIIEKYIIKYIPKGSKDTVEIDPYIDIRPPSTN